MCVCMCVNEAHLYCSYLIFAVGQMKSLPEYCTDQLAGLRSCEYTTFNGERGLEDVIKDLEMRGDLGFPGRAQSDH